MENSDNLHEIIKEELVKLGVQESQNEIKKSFFHHNGARLLGFTSNYLIKTKSGVGCESPKSEKNSGLFIHEGSKTPKMESRSKSPFSKKNLLERSTRKSKKNKENKSSKGVFGCDLDSMELCSAELCDGTLVSIPEFLIVASNIIHQNISIEGIFRKAGSSQRQNELKKILDSGKSLPSSIHPIDAACLMKQFLRSLPTPLLSQKIHILMMRCLDLPKEEQLQALCLCSMLLTKPHQDLLAFILELMSNVASASEENQMDAHNLAIVLAPNLIPAFSSAYAHPKKAFSTPEDTLLAATIDVIQALIEGASGMCRLSEKISVAVRSRALRTRSADSLLAPGIRSEAAPAPASVGRKAKRRSASIHRLVNGLRRVVQGGMTGTSSHLRGSASPTPPKQESATTERGCLVSMTPDIDLTPLKKTVKRKSEEFDLLPDRAEAPSSVPSAGAADKTAKKPRMELKAVRDEVFPFFKEFPGTLRDPRSKKSLAVMSMVTVGVGGTAAAKQRRSLCDNRDAAKLLRSPLQRRKSCTSASLAPFQRTPSFGPSRESPCTEKAGLSKVEIYPKGHNLGPRGAPDGAESSPVPALTPWKSVPLACTPRLYSPNSEDPIDALEQRYDEIKSAVATIEREVDERNLQALREAYLSAHTPTAGVGVSCSELIHDAYKRMKAQTHRDFDFNPSPSEVLSRRLGRELRIRRRRGDEHRVLRSPSERRIGTLRRRSKELELQQQQRNQTDAKPCTPSARVTGDEVGFKSSTPKLKAQLLPQLAQSPQGAALRRGKPNSLRSGLPVVINDPDVMGCEVLAVKGGVPLPPKTVCISRRRLPSSNTPDSFRWSSSSRDPIPLPARITTTTRKTSETNFSPSVGLSPLATPGVSRANSPFPSADSPSVGLSPVVGTPSSTSRENETYDFGEAPSFGCSLLLGSSGQDLSAVESSKWVPATDFLSGTRSTPFRMGATPPSSIEGAGNRPSIAALSRQRKVTANVRLFSQLEDPHSGDQQAPVRGHPLLSSRQGEKSTSKRSSSERSESTPALRSTTRRLSRGQLRNKGSSPKQAAGMISPLRERNSIFQSTPTPKIKGVGASRIRRVDALKAASKLMPLPPRPYKPPSLSLTPKIATPTTHHEAPPMLPPRSLGFCR